jgi:hypothetical protein
MWSVALFPCFQLAGQDPRILITQSSQRPVGHLIDARRHCDRQIAQSWPPELFPLLVIVSNPPAFCLIHDAQDEHQLISRRFLFEIRRVNGMVHFQSARIAVPFCWCA